jgi:hypothetical protein
MLAHCNFIGWPTKLLSGDAGKIAPVSACSVTMPTTKHVRQQTTAPILNSTQRCLKVQNLSSEDLKVRGAARARPLSSAVTSCLSPRAGGASSAICALLSRRGFVAG